MQKFQWPRPPLILGLVLGPLAENRLFLSTENYGATWLLRPGVMVIIALTLAGIFYSLVKAKRKKGRETTKAESFAEPDKTEVRTTRLNWETLFGFFIVVVFCVALWQSRRFSFRAGLFPWAVGFPVLILSIVQLLRDVWGGAHRGGEEGVEDMGPEISPEIVSRRTAGIFGWTIGFFIGIWLFGFSVASPLCTFIYLKMGARERWSSTLILTAAAWILVYVFFQSILRVPFPEGQLFAWLQP